MDIASSSENHTVPAWMVYLLLEAAQQHMSNRFYQKVITEAGLNRFLDETPKETSLKPVASETEFCQFLKGVYKLNGEGVYPLFCLNYGKSIVKLAIKLPLWQDIRDKTQLILARNDLSLVERNQLILQQYNRTPRFVGGFGDLKDGNIISGYKNCIFCRNFKTDKMICHVCKVVDGDLNQFASGKLVRLQQIASVARGDEACVFVHTFAEAIP